MKFKLLALISFLALQSLAQELEKNCLLVAIYEVEKEGKTGVCREYEYVTENVIDEDQFNLLSKDYQLKYGQFNLNLKFVSPTESCIIYQYTKDVSGWGCTKTVYATAIAASIEKCNELINKRYTENIASYKTAPSEVFSWTGNGVEVPDPSKGVVNNLTSVLRYGKSHTGQEFIVASFTNTTTDMVALVGITDEKGVTTLIEVPPGTLTQRFDMKSMQIDVKYKHFEEPTLPIGDYLFNEVKKGIIQFSIENGIIIKKTWSEKMTCFCVRG
jgi:hypothetical protein